MKKRRETRGLIMCNGNYLFCIERKHVDWSCAMEMFFWQGKKSRDTLWLFMCSGNCFFFWEEKKAEKRVDWSCAVDICFFLREKSKETSTSIMCSGIFLRGNAWFDHAQWTFVFWQKTCGFSMCAGCCLILGCSQTTVSGMEQSAPQSNMEN